MDGPQIYVYMVLIFFCFSKGKNGKKLKCADGSRPTCKDGTAGKRATCEKPSLCSDGSTPAAKKKDKKDGKGRKCARKDRVCCDGSAPGNSKPPCDKQLNKGRAVCSVNDPKCS